MSLNWKVFLSVLLISVAISVAKPGAINDVAYWVSDTVIFMVWRNVYHVSDTFYREVQPLVVMATAVTLIGVGMYAVWRILKILWR